MPRYAQLANLARAVAASPGWSLHESAHYFVVTAVGEPAFVDELKRRCESIRAEIRRHFPHPEGDPVPFAVAPPVIRVCDGRESYRRYGGSWDSSGYWHWVEQEIVLYEAERRAETWSTLQGLVFLEYLWELVEESPTPWFLYGHSDYFSGFEALQEGGYRARRFGDRAFHARAMLLEHRARPLQELVRLGPRFGRDWFGKREGDQAQAWSLIWFLRQGAVESDAWDPAWSSLLPAWWQAWLETRDAGLAADRAFAGVDWTALEAAWAELTLRP
jgi:hypothetical protein